MDDDRFTMTIDELRAQMTERFGDDHKDWAFICPNCGDIATYREFEDRGQADLTGQCCIGRLLGALSKDIPKGEYTGRGCDWTAYGLFRGPMRYTFSDGTERWGFRIAPASTPAS